MTLAELSTAVESGKNKDAKRLVNEALEQKESVQDILDTLIGAMSVVGDRFKRNEIYVPEMLVASRAMSSGLKIIEPLLADADVEMLGTVVIGTVKGDLHDIGKNLVAMMMKGAGTEVFDVGIDVPPETFVEKAEEVGADIVCLSALLTTTMPEIGNVIEAFKAAGVRDKYFIMVGGAPVTQQFADEVGADCYTDDAASAAEAAREYLEQKKA